MKKIIALLTTGMLLATGSVLADDSFYDRAKVIKAKPIYETVTVNHPEERCWNERVYYRGRSHNKSYTPTIAGAIVGGVVGNQFGKGRGKDAMTVAGALLGGSIGNDLSKKHRAPGYYEDERRCEVIDHFEEHEELIGYRVKYRYKGQIFWTRTDQHPGDFIPVVVSVTPTSGRNYDFHEYD